MIVRQLRAEIDAFFTIGLSRRQLLPNRKVPAPRGAAEIHPDAHLFVERLSEEVAARRLETRLQVGIDAVTDDVEEPAFAAGESDLVGNSLPVVAARQRSDIDDAHAAHGWWRELTTFDSPSCDGGGSSQLRLLPGAASPLRSPRS